MQKNAKTSHIVVVGPKTRLFIVYTHNKINERVAEEGITLLKNQNNALPLNKGSKVSLFGKWSAVPLISGSGSSGTQRTQAEKEKYSIENVFARAGLELNKELYSFYYSKNGGKTENQKQGDEVSVSLIPDNVKNTYVDYNDMAIIFISRSSGEGHDHAINSLQLTKNEYELFKYVKSLEKVQGIPMFKNIMYVFNTAGPFDCSYYEDNGEKVIRHTVFDDERVTAEIWLGYLGGSGIEAFPKILTGKINPSGKTVDLWPANFETDPTYSNICNNKHMGGNSEILGKDPVGNDLNGAFHMQAYKEGIYMGYRWYETAIKEERYYSNMYGEGENAQDVSDPLHKDDVYYNRFNGVLFPFGFGLSYTDFEWKVGEPNLKFGNLTKNDAGTEVFLPIKVKNNGKISGKEVVQLYVNAPYDTKTAPIEKSNITFVKSIKTKILNPGETQEVTIKFNIHDLASFDWNDLNHNGFSGYELEKGKYNLFLRSDSHTDKNVVNCSYEVKDTIKYDGSSNALNYNNGFGISAENVFSKEDTLNSSGVGNINTNGEEKFLKEDIDYTSRSHFVLPSTLTDDQRTWSNASVKNLFDSMRYFANMDKTTDPWYVAPETIPGYGKKRSELKDRDWKQASKEDVDARKDGKTDVQLKDMIGIPFDDSKWVTFMNQMTFDEMVELVTNGFFDGAGLQSIGEPKTHAADGAVQFAPAGKERGTCWCVNSTLGATWNPDLAYEVGYQMGQEILLSGGTSWYGPGLDIRRTPYGGRNWEYYSQDGVQGGWIAAGVIKGTTDMGIHVFAKHFVCNDQETTRYSLSVFCNEQALREIYLKPFEIATKYGNMNGVMTANNKLALTATATQYHLNRTFLCDECGMKGYSTTDGWGDLATHIYPGQLCFTGNMLARNYVCGLVKNIHNASEDFAAKNGRVIEGRYDSANNKVFVSNSKVDQTSWVRSEVSDGAQYAPKIIIPGEWNIESSTQWSSVRNLAQHMLYDIANSSAMLGMSYGNQVGYVVNLHNGDTITEMQINGETLIIEPKAPELSSVTKRFTGWYLDENFTTLACFPLEINKPLDLYASIVDADICIQFYNMNYGEDSEIKSQIYDRGTRVSLPVFNPYREGYEFSGWYLESNCINKADSEALEINVDRTFYAKWIVKEKFTIMFDYNDDEINNIKSVTVFKGESVVPPMYSPVAKEGYVFTGWYKDTNCEEKMDFNVPIDYDLKLYAGWHKLDIEEQSLKVGCGSSIDITVVYIAFFANALVVIYLLNKKRII